jgi:hypothetical protein
VDWFIVTHSTPQRCDADDLEIVLTFSDGRDVSFITLKDGIIDWSNADEYDQGLYEVGVEAKLTFTGS